jgi:hypothetical protein
MELRSTDRIGADALLGHMKAISTSRSGQEHELFCFLCVISGLSSSLHYGRNSEVQS